MDMGDKGGGRRSLEDQNAYDAVMIALNSANLTTAKFGRLLSCTLNVSHRQMKRGRAIRKSMEDMDKKRWIRWSSAVSKMLLERVSLENCDLRLSSCVLCYLFCTNINFPLVVLSII